MTFCYGGTLNGFRVKKIGWPKGKGFISSGMNLGFKGYGYMKIFFIMTLKLKIVDKD